MGSEIQFVQVAVPDVISARIKIQGHVSGNVKAYLRPRGEEVAFSRAPWLGGGGGGRPS